MIARAVGPHWQGQSRRVGVYWSMRVVSAWTRTWRSLRPREVWKRNVLGGLLIEFSRLGHEELLIGHAL